MKNSSAFTLIELIIVIVVIGILAVFGTNIYLDTYETYTMSSRTNKMQNETELALAQINNRLQNRIKESVIAYDPITTNFVSLQLGGVQYEVLEWVGYDIDSFLGGNNNTSTDWSGFADLTASGANNVLRSPGSNFTNLQASVSRLSNGVVNLNSIAAPNSIVTFIQDIPSSSSFGWHGAATTNIHPVVRINNTDLNTTGGWVGVGKRMVEQYYYSWTAYALVPNVPNQGDLSLYYNFRPWNGDTYLNGQRATIAENVSAFRFRQDGTAIQLQLCLDDSDLSQALDDNGGFAFCKEITIF